MKIESKESTMTNKIYDEKNGLYYEQQGDYLIPCLSLANNTDKPIGILGQINLRYIKEYRQMFYNNSLTSRKLNGYLFNIEEQIKNTFNFTIKQH